MVRVAGFAAADEAGLFGDKAKVLPVTQPLGLRQGHFGPAVHSNLAIGLVVRLLPHTKLALSHGLRRCKDWSANKIWHA